MFELLQTRQKCEITEVCSTVHEFWQFYAEMFHLRQTLAF
jgi:hypothetical protein